MNNDIEHSRSPSYWLQKDREAKMKFFQDKLSVIRQTKTSATKQLQMALSNIQEFSHKLPNNQKTLELLSARLKIMIDHFSLIKQNHGQGKGHIPNENQNAGFNF